MDKDTEFIIRSRYIEKDGELIKLIKKFQSLQQAVASNANNNNDNDNMIEESKSNDSNTNAALIYSQLFRDIDVFHGNLSRYPLIESTQHSEYNYYDQHKHNLQQKIQQTKQELITLNEELITQTRLRNEQEEYDKLYKTINAYPSRSDSEKQIQALDNDIMLLTVQQETLIQSLQSRQKQFGDVVNTIQELSKQWKLQENIPMKMEH